MKLKIDGSPIFSNKETNHFFQTYTSIFMPFFDKRKDIFVNYGPHRVRSHSFDESYDEYIINLLNDQSITQKEFDYLKKERNTISFVEIDEIIFYQDHIPELIDYCLLISARLTHNFPGCVVNKIAVLNNPVYGQQTITIHYTNEIDEIKKITIEYNLDLDDSIFKGYLRNRSDEEKKSFLISNMLLKGIPWMSSKFDNDPEIIF